MAKMNPLERLGVPGDISEVVSFRAGPGRWVNGRTGYVNAARSDRRVRRPDRFP